MRLVIGVDFDGTIVTSNYPAIGKSKFMAIPILRWLQRRHTVVLWTCRGGQHLDKALNWCRDNGLRFNFVNVNTFERIKEYGGDCRKLSCDILVDDTAGFVFWPWVLIRVLLWEVKTWLINL